MVFVGLLFERRLEESELLGGIFWTVAAINLTAKSTKVYAKFAEVGDN